VYYHVERRRTRLEEEERKKDALEGEEEERSSSLFLHRFFTRTDRFVSSILFNKVSICESLFVSDLRGLFDILHFAKSESTFVPSSNTLRSTSLH